MLIQITRHITANDVLTSSPETCLGDVSPMSWQTNVCLKVNLRIITLKIIQCWFFKKLVYNFPHIYIPVYTVLCVSVKGIKKIGKTIHSILNLFIHQDLVLFKHTNILQSYLSAVYLLYGTCNINNFISITVIYDLINTNSVNVF